MLGNIHYDRVRITSDKVRTRLTSEGLDHEFTVSRVEHNLNTRSGNFATTVEAVFFVKKSTVDILIKKT